jgi:hypothetical protein
MLPFLKTIFSGIFGQLFENRPPLNDYLNPVMCADHSFLMGTIGAAVEIFSRLNAVTNNFAATMLASGCQGMNGAFKTIIVMRDAVDDYFQVLVVFVSADFTLIHKLPPLLRLI